MSPDGGEIATLRFERPSRWSILEVIPSGGGQAREIFRDKIFTERFSGLAWSPDKRYVLMVRGPSVNAPAALGSEFLKIPVGGGAAESTGLKWPGTMRFPTLDPKGSRLVFVGTGGEEPAVLAIEKFLPVK